jgi:hypothetical protein
MQKEDSLPGSGCPDKTAGIRKYKKVRNPEID